jgi:phage terminase large subunit-like protein
LCHKKKKNKKVSGASLGLVRVDRPTQYAESVVNGTIDRPVGKTEILCCKRHLNDLDRQGTDEFPYIWDKEKSHVMIDFAENLILAEGEPKPFKCKGFQDFIFGSWNGWVHKNTGYRRYHTSYIQVARQNGKSIGNSIPALYYGNFAGYQYPQIYTTAIKEFQAKIILRECYKFINADEELSGTKTKNGLFTIQDYKSQILCNLTGGYIKALGRDTESIDGLRSYFGSVDEYMKHKTNQMYKLLVDGSKNLPEYLISVITTAGFDLNSPCKELYDYCINVLNGVVIDETQFIFICEIDKEDINKKNGVFDESVWPKANPLWTPQRFNNLKADAVKAKEMQGEELRNFMTKGLNIWVQFTDTQFINPEHWKKCESDTTLEDMRGKECYLGIDLSSGGDLTSVALEFPFNVDNEKKYFVDSHSFIPSNRVADHIKTDKAPYDMWIREGLLTVTETLGGVKTDYKYILTYYKEILEKYDLKLKGIAYDPHNADAFLNDLESFGINCVMIVQSCKSLNDATVDFKLEVEAGNIIYDKRNKLLTWSVIYAKTVSNSFKEIKVDKDITKKGRIDPVDAVINAHKLTIASKDTCPYTADRGIIML